MLEFVDRLFRWLLSALMALLVVSVTWQILSRYLLSEPSSWTEELARFLLVWIGILGASYAYKVKMHLGIDLLAQRLRGGKAFALDVFVNAVVAGFALAVMVVGGSKLVAMTWELNQVSPALGLPMAWVYTVVPLSGALITIYAAENCLHGWREYRDGNTHGRGSV
ncbi:TRAP transporter small permease [Parahaliea maris]|nr:TRAP transporter small permease [Parahaliea maris]